jgi:amidophosphoribosyltransferase
VKELIAADRTIDEIAEKLGADSIEYLSVDGLKSAVQTGLRNAKSVGHCTACLTGSYPVPIEF